MSQRRLRITLTVEPEDPTDGPFLHTELHPVSRAAIDEIVRQATRQIARAVEDQAFAEQVLATKV